MKKALLFTALLFSLLFALPLAVSADSPPPPNFFYINITNADASVSYADILIKIDRSDKNYTELNSYNAGKYDFGSSAPIVAYDQDGYRSISFHLKNVQTDHSPTREGPSFSSLFEFQNGYKPISTVTDSIKIALLDEDGNILKVSDAVSVMPGGNTYPNQVEYDATGNKPIVNFVPYYRGSAANTYFSPMYFLLFLISMVISTAIETVIALPFKIRPLWKIIVVNIVTQILLFLFITLSGLPYLTAVIIGEIFVYISEFAAYLLLYKKISRPRLALYTFTANSASLIAGLVLENFFILGRVFP